MKIASKYIPENVEKSWYQLWLEEKAFSSIPDDRDSFTIVIPPPNVTGVLTMGHVLNNTIQDILVRYHRMNGFNTLWQPGTDHAGIATQMVVERNLSEKNINRKDLTREEFIEKIWEWKEYSGSTIINQLKLYHFANTIPISICDDQGFTLIKSANKYYPKNDTVIPIQGKFGIGISTVDYYNNSHNKCGIYKAELYFDDQLCFDLKIDALDFETTKQINVYKDYKAYQNKRESIHKLFIHPLNNLSFYDINLGDGTLKLKDDNIHKITIKVSDINNNSSYLNFYVKASNKSKCSTEPISKKINKKIVNKDSSCIVILDSNTLYDRQEVNVKYNNMLQIASKDIPVNQSFAVAVKLKQPMDGYSNKLLLAHVDQKGKIKNRKGKINNGWLETKLNHFGDFQLMMDTIPPSLKPIYQPKEIKMNEALKFKVTDDLSGVESYEVTFDDRWVLANYNYKTSQLMIPMDRYAKLENKKYDCLIKVKDERNNEMKYSFEIFVHNK